jgi:hypothetical protein
MRDIADRAGNSKMPQLLALRPRPGAVLYNNEQLTFGALRARKKPGWVARRTWR